MSSPNRIIVTLCLLATLITTVAAPAPAPRSAFQTQVETWAAANDYNRGVPPIGERGENEQIEQRAASRLNRETYPTGRLPSGDWRGEALRQLNALPVGVPEGMGTLTLGNGNIDAVVPMTTSWVSVGPAPLDSNGTTNNAYNYGTVSGRVNAITFAPGSATTAYIGMPISGLWKTTNCCTTSTTWTQKWDAPTFGAHSVGAIAVDPNNSNAVFAGTGDSQVPAGDMYGNGVYRSYDGGNTWTQFGASVFSPYTSAGAPGAACCVTAPDQNIKSIIVHPSNGNIIIVGASYGLFMSWDAGVTWTQYDVVNRNAVAYTDDAQRISDILLDTATNTMYVAIGYPYTSARRLGLRGGANGIYKATVPMTPGAPTFTAINTGLPAGTGNGTTNDVGRIELSWNAAHTRMFAAISNYGISNANLMGTLVGIYTTSLSPCCTWSLLANTDETWSMAGGGKVLTNWLWSCSPGGPGTKTDEFGQDWYDIDLVSDQNNAQVLYIGRTGQYKVTLDAGFTTATMLSMADVYGTSCANYGTLHPDQHAITVVPGSNPTKLLSGNDGGIYYTNPGAAAGSYHTQLSGNGGAGSISSNQFYAGQIGANFANAGANQWLFGGMQDNGSATWNGGDPNFKWTARSTGGDGFFTSFDPLGGSLSAGMWYTEYTYGEIGCSSTGADGPFSTGSPNPCQPSYTGDARQDWSTPFMLDQWNCNTTGAGHCDNLIAAGTLLWASSSFSGGFPVWSRTGTTDLTKNIDALSTIISVNFAHKSPGAVLIGTSDGNVQMSHNVYTGASCTAATANTTSFACTVNTAATWANLTNGNAVLPNRAIQAVAFDPNFNSPSGSNLRFWVAISGFNTNTPGTPGHLFQGTCSAFPCTAGNVTWVDKTGGITLGPNSTPLPDMPFYSVEANPNIPDQVFVGTALGFFYTNNISAADPLWYRFQNGMGNTLVQFLAVDRGPVGSPYASTTLAAYTYGRGTYLARLGPVYSPTAIDTDAASISTPSTNTLPVLALALAGILLAIGAAALDLRRTRA